MRHIRSLPESITLRRCLYLQDNRMRILRGSCSLNCNRNLNRNIISLHTTKNHISSLISNMKSNIIMTGNTIRDQQARNNITDNLLIKVHLRLSKSIISAIISPSLILIERSKYIYQNLYPKSKLNLHAHSQIHNM